jgi:hypothetical protein
MLSMASKESARGGQEERLLINFYNILFPLFLIASHPPPFLPPFTSSFPLNRLTVHAGNGENEMGESLGGRDVKIHGKKGDAGGSADFLSGLSSSMCVPGLGMLRRGMLR